MATLAALLAAHHVSVQDCDTLLRCGIRDLEDFACANLRARGCTVGATARLKPVQAAVAAFTSSGAVAAAASSSAMVAGTCRPSTGGINLRDAVLAMSYQDAAQASVRGSCGASKLLALCRGLDGRRYACSLGEYRATWHRDTSQAAALPFFPPPFRSAAELGRLSSSHPLPFLTTAGGAGPSMGVPKDLEAYLSTYVMRQRPCANDRAHDAGPRRDLPPHVLINEHTIPTPMSCAEAARVIRAACSAGDRVWAASLLPEMLHPPWWPVGACSIPLYEHLLIGTGRTGVGMHRDRFVRGVHASEPEPCVALARRAVRLDLSLPIARLSKARDFPLPASPCLLTSGLPTWPTGQRCDPNACEREHRAAHVYVHFAGARRQARRADTAHARRCLPRRRPRATHKSYCQHRGWSDRRWYRGLLPGTGTGGTPGVPPLAASHSRHLTSGTPYPSHCRGRPRGHHWRRGMRYGPREALFRHAAVPDGTTSTRAREGAWGLPRASMARLATPCRAPPSRVPLTHSGVCMCMLEQVVAAGGFWFDLGARRARAGSVMAGSAACMHSAADVQDAEGQAEDAMCLFLPAGWWHWLVADCEWHVAWSASFFPDADRASRSEM